MWRFEGTGQARTGLFLRFRHAFDVLSGLGWYIFLVEFFHKCVQIRFQRSAVLSRIELEGLELLLFITDGDGHPFHCLSPLHKIFQSGS